MNTRFLSCAWRVLFALVFALSLTGVSSQQARATGYVVSTLNDSGAGSLRQAILDANANSGIPDTITFSVSGTITLASSLPNITDDLIIDGSGRSVTISGNSLYRVMHINSGKSLSINELSIINGKATASTGGGIDNAGGTLIVTNSTFSGNFGQWGGAICIVAGSTVTVSNSAFYDNDALYGAGIYSENATATVSNSTFSGNAATSIGGGIFSRESSLTVTNSTFSGNSAVYSGGGIYGYQEIGTNTMTVTNSSFSANSVTEATGCGAGICNMTGTLNLKNIILANSTAGLDCESYFAPFTGINNLIESHYGCGTPVSSADPLLGPLAGNGGPTQTFALLPGSPAIDAGDDAICAAAPVSNKDQRGVTRPYGAHCDIGSFELNKSTLTFRSVGAYDGHILESGENTTAGGTLDSTGATFNLGDEAIDKQYRAILSFDTTALPNNAIITRVLLKIRKQGVVGTDPFSLLGGLKVDIRKPYFGTGVGLVVGDFQAVAGRANAATFRITPVNNWYIAVVNSLGYPYINLAGTTQFRLRFLIDDNNDNAADYMKFISGNHATVAARPTLVITYYLP